MEPNIDQPIAPESKPEAKLDAKPEVTPAGKHLSSSRMQG